MSAPRVYTTINFISKIWSRNPIWVQNNLPRRTFTYELLEDKEEKQEVKVTFISTINGKKYEVKGKVGESLIEIAARNKIQLVDHPNFAYICDTQFNCGACHVILPKKDYESILKTQPLAHDISGSEEDTLELYYENVTPTSRLGCCIVMTKELDNLQVQIHADNSNYVTFKRHVNEFMYRSRYKCDYYVDQLIRFIRRKIKKLK